MGFNENYKTIKNLLNNEIKYPLIIKGLNKEIYFVYDIIFESNYIKILTIINQRTFIKYLHNFSFEFQENLIKELKSFENNIWND